MKTVKIDRTFIQSIPGAPISQIISFGNFIFSFPYLPSNLFQTVLKIISGSLISSDVSSGRAVSAVLDEVRESKEMYSYGVAALEGFAATFRLTLVGKLINQYSNRMYLSCSGCPCS